MAKLKNSNCDKTQKFKFWQNSKTQIVTKLSLWKISIYDKRYFKRVLKYEHFDTFTTDEMFDHLVLRPSTDMWHVTCDMGHVTCDMWYVTGDRWQVTGDRWHVTGDRWQATGYRWPVTGDRWTVTGDRLQVTGNRQQVTGISIFVLIKSLYSTFFQNPWGYP